MAEAKKGVLVAGTDGNITIPVGAAMPPDEPGHKGAELNAGATPFDPNAARRFAEGRGPGMQDSERKDPAHWVQPISLADSAQAEVDALERELKAAKDRLAETKGK